VHLSSDHGVAAPKSRALWKRIGAAGSRRLSVNWRALARLLDRLRDLGIDLIAVAPADDEPGPAWDQTGTA